MKRTRAQFFSTNPLFRGVSEEDADALEGRAEVVTFRKKQLVWEPGAAADRVWFVRSGIVRIGKVSDEGRELTLSFHVKNDLFGEVAAFGNGPHETVAETYEDLVAASLAREEFVRFLRQWPEVAIRVSGLVFERRKRLENRVAALLFKTAHARLASLFVDLAADFGVRDSRGVIVNLKLTHKEMASLIGATRETVSFAILDLRKEGLIQTESKRVILLDLPRLQALMKI